jgi:tetratricopeptide (TPR) repeat protein
MFRLLVLLRKAHETLKRRNYQYAFDFAERNGIAGIFHRFIVFFPDSVNQLIQQGKPTGLPRAMLRFPLFQKEIPVFTVHLLGDPIIYRNQRYLKTSLQPKDAAFLIFLAHAQTERINLARIYDNFWPASKNASRNLAHLLVRLRKALKIPSQFLYVKGKSLFCDCYFQTDYAQSLEHTAQAHALLKDGEWGFAKKEFKRAFSFYRAEPFKKMYDDWSDDKRLEILFRYENGVLGFAKELLKRGRKEEAHRLLRKAQKIVPYSDEIGVLVD